MLSFPTMVYANTGEDTHTDMKQSQSETSSETIKEIHNGDLWRYSVNGFFAGGFRVLPLSGGLTYAVTSGARTAPDDKVVFALSHNLNLTGGDQPFGERGVIYFRQGKDRGLEEYGTENDGWIKKGPVQYLPGHLSPDFHEQRQFEYQNGASEVGQINVTAEREIETAGGRYNAFKVEDIHRRTEPNGAFTRVNDTGWFVPALGFFARGAVTIRAYDAGGRFRNFQLHGFTLEGTTVFD